MPEPVVYWHGSVVAYRTGAGPITVIWCLNPIKSGETALSPGHARPMPGAAPKPKAKRGK